jgi:hypothetical protein
MSPDRSPQGPSIRCREAFPLLFAGRWVARGLAAAINALDAAQLVTEYRSLRQQAPRRAARGLRYFVGHDGIPGSGPSTNRREEHLAIALCNTRRIRPLPDGGSLRLLDYQVPLKARRSDAGIGKLDLLGLDDDGRLVVVEVKVDGHAGGRGEAPPAALMEALRYTAIVEASQSAIAAEIHERLGLTVQPSPPRVLLLGTRAWWHAWRNVEAAGRWVPAFLALLEQVQSRLGVEVVLAQLAPIELTYGRNGAPPRLTDLPRLEPVDLAAR